MWLCQEAALSSPMANITSAEAAEADPAAAAVTKPLDSVLDADDSQEIVFYERMAPATRRLLWVFSL